MNTYALALIVKHTLCDSYKIKVSKNARMLVKAVNSKAVNSNLSTAHTRDNRN